MNNDITSSNIVGLQENDAFALDNLVKNLNHNDSLCFLKNNKKDKTINYGQTIKVSCRINTGSINEHILALYDPEKDRQFPSGLELHTSLLRAKGGGGEKSSKVEIDIQNTTRHDIVRKRRTALGRLQLV